MSASAACMGHCRRVVCVDDLKNGTNMQLHYNVFPTNNTTLLRSSRNLTVPSLLPVACRPPSPTPIVPCVCRCEP